MRPLSLTILIGAAAAFLVGITLRGTWWGDLFAHFMPYYLVAFLAVLALGPGRRLRFPALGLVVAVAATMALAPVDYAASNPGEAQAGIGEGPPGATITVAAVNLYVANGRYDAVARFMREAAPDIAYFSEVTPAWLEELRRIAGDLGYAMVGRPAEDFYGNALLSRGPIADAKFFALGEGEPKLQAVVRLGGADVRIGGVHMAYPLHPRTAEVQRRETEWIADFVLGAGSPVILLGDFNATPWSYVLARLHERAGLRASPSTLVGTWPTGLPLRIPIDHIFAAAGARVLSTALGADIGSDHFPVIGRVRIGPPTAPEGPRSETEG
jgi:endonuclease/exonuclease/phosphatase (EEP) superfamily protein YafD